MQDNVSYFKAAEQKVASTYFNADGDSKPTALTTEDKTKLETTVLAIQSAAGTIGTLGGVYLAYKKNKGFWGYVGFMFLGGIVGGSIGYLATLPMRAKLTVNEEIKNK